MSNRKFKFTRKCLCCGKEFQTNSPQKLYCDGEHYLPCPVCGKPVLKTDKDFSKPPKCCSSQCAQELRKQKISEKVCEICGDKFKPNSGNATICDKEHHIQCEICGKDFIVTKKMWHDGIRTCSDECRKEKTRRLNQAKYGVDHPMQNDEVKERHKQAMLEVYGVEHALQSQEIRNKVIATNLGKYDLDWALKDFEVRQKAAATMVERYGGKTTLESPALRQKVTKTNLKKFGVANPLSNSEIQDKVKQTNLNKYGYANPSSNPEVREKAHQTLTDRYGPNWREVLQDKAKQSTLRKYGVDNVFKSPTIQNKAKANFAKKYGASSAMTCDELRAKLVSTHMKRYGVPYGVMTPQARDNNNKVESQINRKFASELEKLGFSVELEHYIGHKSYDILINETKTFVEIDPSYSHTCDLTINHWHSSLSPTYHIEKTTLANEHGYKCIHIFDWENWTKVMQLLKPKHSVYARACSVKQIDQSEAVEFTAKYHLQGSCKGQVINYGLYLDDELIEVMTFGRPRYNKNYDLELLRLCTKDDIRVIGGASKLFKAFCKDNPDSSVISYCDLSKFTGQVYEKLGMKLLRRTQPAKVWSKGHNKITDNLLRQRGYDQLFNANYGKGTSNEELMLKDGWIPVYDCGQAVYMIER